MDPESPDSAACVNAFCKISGGYSCNHAIKLLGGQMGWGGDPAVRKCRPPIYDEAITAVLWANWKVAEQPCGVQLRVLLPIWLPHYEEEIGGLEPELRRKVLAVSASQIDRLLAPSKVRAWPVQAT